MALPKINAPEFEAVIPSTNQSIYFRPFLVKEEKILFMALQGGDNNEIINAVKNILRSCIITEEVDVDNLAVFDIEYLFLKLRGKSVSENIELKLKHRDSECNHVTEYDLNLDSIKVYVPENHNKKIMITDDIGVQMKYPTIDGISKLQTLDKNNMEQIIDVIVQCIDVIFDTNTVYEDYTRDELVSFIEALNQTQFTKLAEFFNTMPKIRHEIQWKCLACGEEEKVIVEGLENFFT